MRKYLVLTDLISFIGLLLICILSFEASETWYKVIMIILLILSLVRLIYDYRKYKKEAAE